VGGAAEMAMSARLMDRAAMSVPVALQPAYRAIGGHSANIGFKLWRVCDERVICVAGEARREDPPVRMDWIEWSDRPNV